MQIPHHTSRSTEIDSDCVGQHSAESLKMDHAFSKEWHGVGPIASTHPASPIPLLHRWLPDRFCLDNQPAIPTSCTSKISLCGWPASLLLLSSLEADGFRRQAHSETCSARESRLETYYAVGPNSFSFDCYAQFEPCRCCGFTLVG